MRGRPREFDRAAALDRAMELFWAQGYEATGVAQICETLGLGRQSLYNAFGDKHALFVEALGSYRERMMQPVIQVLEGPGSPLANVETVLGWWEAGPTGRIECGCLVANSMAEFGTSDAEVVTSLSAVIDRFESALISAFRRAVDEGELDPETDPVELARAFVTMGQGLSVMRRLDPESRFVQGVVDTARRLLHR